MDMARFQLTASIGFTFDTSLAVARMIYDGFFDRYANLKIIAAHGGGALPYLVRGWTSATTTSRRAAKRSRGAPPSFLPQIFADAVVFSPDVLDLCMKVFGADNVMYGSDYPHTIGDLPGCLKRVNGLARRGARQSARAHGGARVRLLIR
jgi:aminocarboxymuconate-semialdehyde decarboxylase